MIVTVERVLVTMRVDCDGTAVTVVPGGAIPGMHWEYPEGSVSGLNEGLNSFRTVTKKNISN